MRLHPVWPHWSHSEDSSTLRPAHMKSKQLLQSSCRPVYSWSQSKWKSLWTSTAVVESERVWWAVWASACLWLSSLSSTAALVWQRLNAVSKGVGQASVWYRSAETPWNTLLTEVGLMGHFKVTLKNVKIPKPVYVWKQSCRNISLQLMFVCCYTPYLQKKLV